MVGRSTKPPRRRGNLAVGDPELGPPHGLLIRLIDDLNAAVRAKRRPERIGQLLIALRQAAEEHLRQQHTLLREIRSRTHALQDWAGISQLREMMANLPIAGPDAWLTRLAGLTSRERQVLALVVKGHSNKEIAKLLGIGQRTVESHRAGVMKKIGARSLPELIRLAIVGTSVDKK